MDLGRRGTTPYIFTFRCLILTWFFGFGKRLLQFYSCHSRPCLREDKLRRGFRIGRVILLLKKHVCEDMFHGKELHSIERRKQHFKYCLWGFD